MAAHYGPDGPVAGCVGLDECNTHGPRLHERVGAHDRRTSLGAVPGLAME